MGVQTKGKYTFGNKTRAQILALTTGEAKTGTVSSTGTTVTGSGTLFLSELKVGDVIRAVNESRVVASITNDTSLTIDEAIVAADWSAASFTHENPKRIQKGATVFNTSDSTAMVYSGDDEGFWSKGEFVPGNGAALTNGYVTLSLTEGQVLETSRNGQLQDAIKLHDTAGVESAIAVAYDTILSGHCMPTILSGAHNIECGVSTVTKANYFAGDGTTGGDAVNTGASETTGAAGDLGMALTDNSSNLFTGFLMPVERTNTDAVTTILSIGAGTNNVSYNPFYYLYDYSWTHNIYLQSEVGSAKTITALEWDFGGWTTPYNVINQTVKLAHITESVFDSTPAEDLSDVTLANLTTVYTGSFSVSTNNFIKLTLDTPFSYNGTSNLLVIWENRDGTWTSGGGWAEGFTASQRGAYDWEDGSYPTVDGTRVNNVPNIKIHY
jgi:hypothetical protein